MNATVEVLSPVRSIMKREVSMTILTNACGYGYTYTHHFIYVTVLTKKPHIYHLHIPEKQNHSIVVIK